MGVVGWVRGDGEAAAADKGAKVHLRALGFRDRARVGWGWPCGSGAYTEGQHPDEGNGEHVDLDVLDPIPKDGPNVPLLIPLLNERIALAPTGLQPPELLPKVETTAAAVGVGRAVGDRSWAAEAVHRAGEPGLLARDSVGWEKA